MEDIMDINESNVKTYRYARTDALRTINDLAVERELNRSLSIEGVVSLDPDGFHVLKETWVLDNGFTLRTEWLCKMIGSELPAIVFIDTAPDDDAWKVINSLPIAIDQNTNIEKE